MSSDISQVQVSDTDKAIDAVRDLKIPFKKSLIVDTRLDLVDYLIEDSVCHMVLAQKLKTCHLAICASFDLPVHQS